MKPTIFWSDAPFAAMVDYYPWPQFQNLTPESRKYAMAADTRAVRYSAAAIYRSSWGRDVAIRDHRGDPGDRVAAGVVVDHARPGGHGDQQERPGELDDEPDPQRPLLEHVLIEPDQVAPLEGGGVLPLSLLRVGRAVRHAAPLVRP